MHVCGIVIYIIVETRVCMSEGVFEGGQVTVMILDIIVCLAIIPLSLYHIL